jgi:pyruvate/2-oxoglutarate dehydrogenase complex dihydrolipoamide acyltransferase (E2) component
MNDIGTYEERKFPVSRIPTVDTLEQGRKKHHVPILFEVDVTEGLRCLGELKAGTGRRISFTGWAVKCIGQAVSEHKYIHALRKGRRRLILFDDVDISIVVERAVRHGDGRAETLPMPYLVRKSNEKSVREIHHEIRNAQECPLEKNGVQIGERRNVRAVGLFAMMPKFLRDLVLWRRFRNNPFFAKKMMGTVVVTSIGEAGKGGGYGWGIPVGIHPLIIALGSIARKPGVVGDAIVVREYLGMTVLFDHDVIDGAPVARFVQRLKALLEAGYGLADQERLPEPGR